MDGRAELAHGLAVERDPKREGVAVLLKSDAAGVDGDKAVWRFATGAAAAAADPVLNVVHADALLRALGDGDHACTMERDHHFL